MKREVSVALLNGLNVVAAFAGQMLVYRALGISGETDVYFASVALPQLVLTVTTGLAAGVLVPMLAARPPAEQDALTSALLAWLLGLVALPLMLALATVSHWVPLLFPGFEGANAALAADLVQVQLLALPFVMASALFAARRQAREAFVQVEAMNLATAAVSLLGMAILLPRFGVLTAAWLYVARYAAQAGLLGRGLRWSPGQSGPQQRSGLRQFWQRGRVLLAGSAYFKADLLVDRYLLSHAAAGSLSLFSLAQTVFNAAAGVIGQAWGGTIVPRLAAAQARGDIAGFKGLYRRQLLRIGAVALVAVLLAVGLVPPLVGLVAAQRPVTGGGGSLALLLLSLAGVPVFGGMGALVSGCFYALGDTRTPTLLSIVTFTLFIFGKWLVFDRYGLYAFCMLTSAYYALNALLLGAILERRLARKAQP